MTEWTNGWIGQPKNRLTMPTLSGGKDIIKQGVTARPNGT